MYVLSSTIEDSSGRGTDNTHFVKQNVRRSCMTPVSYAPSHYSPLVDVVNNECEYVPYFR